mmetsp:Transcript_12349/g.43501  ORF Transcript_12349/g.43501 Transcript_12349/m.43501 type:complete len:232 (-) Transcript_12349:1247-1942(-)
MRNLNGDTPIKQRELDRGRVQKCPERKGLVVLWATTVLQITDDRVPRATEVQPDLVRAAGRRPRLHQRGLPRDVRFRRRGPAAALHDAHEGLRRLAVDRAVEADLLIPRRVAQDEGVIAFVDPAAGEQLRAALCLLLGASQKQRARGAIVQPMAGPGVPQRPRRRLTGEPLGDGNVAGQAFFRIDQPVEGFVHDDQVALSPDFGDTVGSQAVGEGGDHAQAVGPCKPTALL